MYKPSERLAFYSNRRNGDRTPALTFYARGMGKKGGVSSMNDFLPSGYTVPASNDKYYKFQPGENRFRVVSEKAITGWKWWIEDSEGKRSPRRIPSSQPIPVAEIEEPDKIKHFWAFVVWNYKTEKVQILEITQKGIQKSLETLINDEDYGSPRNYDVVVKKSGEGLETKYEVMPKPPKPLDTGIAKLYEDMHINLDALYDGEDPFVEGEPKVDNDEVDKGIEEQKFTRE